MLIVLIIVIDGFIAVLNLLLEFSQFQDSISTSFYEWSLLLCQTLLIMVVWCLLKQMSGENALVTVEVIS